ncbi:transposase [Nocardia takedensis]|uniref:transposase n=1 Tax=Nocardia takedensis TaxID=259390 RepID=UPI0002E21D44|nr:transposase [Nocardia takedensis]
MPMMYSPQFRERAVALLLEEGRRVADVAQDLGVTEGSLYRWKQQALIDRGEAPGTPTVESALLRDALSRIKQLEEELRATRLAAEILRDTTISPKGGSRLPRP